MRLTIFLILFVLITSCNQNNTSSISNVLSKEDFIEIMAQSDLFDIRFKDLNGYLKDSMLMESKNELYKKYNINDSLISIAISHYAKSNQADAISEEIKKRTIEILDGRMTK